MLVIKYIYFNNILKTLFNYQDILTILLKKDNFQCMYIKIGSIDFFQIFLRIKNEATCI